MKEKIVIEVTGDNEITIKEILISSENFLWTIACLIEHMFTTVKGKLEKDGVDAEKATKTLDIISENLKNIIDIYK